MRVIGKHRWGIDMQVCEVPHTTFFAHLEHLVYGGGILFAVCGVQVHHARVETLVALEDHVLGSAGGVPERKAVVVVTATLRDAEGCGKLVAIAEVVPVATRFVQKSATGFVVGVRFVVDEQRVDVA